MLIIIDRVVERRRKAPVRVRHLRYHRSACCSRRPHVIQSTVSSKSSKGCETTQTRQGNIPDFTINTYLNLAALTQPVALCLPKGTQTVAKKARMCALVDSRCTTPPLECCADRLSDACNRYAYEVLRFAYHTHGLALRCEDKGRLCGTINRTLNVTSSLALAQEPLYLDIMKEENVICRHNSRTCSWLP
jgi:hypothetical protein